MTAAETTAPVDDRELAERTLAGEDARPLLAQLAGPEALKELSPARLPELAAEIRSYLVESVARTGGHLGPNLGAVEVTIALHRVFDSPRDRIVFDTGHQAYVHKMLTGRVDGFASLRRAGGLSGYPSRSESPHDVVENSHASTALSYADGLAKAEELRQGGGAVVAVVGDGALTGGMCWEALNNIGGSDRPVVIVLNDNGRSYDKTIGGLAQHLSSLRDRRGYAAVVDLLRRSGALAADEGVPAGGDPAPALFEALGLAYRGPVDGHDIGAVSDALAQARALGRPVVVHCVTTKGCGYPPAESDPEDHLHAVGPIDPATGRALRRSGGGTPATPATWTATFGDELVRLARGRRDVVGVTAAMAGPTGLRALQKVFPERVFDVGIAEQHAVASAAGLATAGLHPVVAVYSTFLSRAFDQVLMDVALHGMPVTFVLDRAGVTGEDGPSHHGMWDMSLFAAVPGLRVAAPRDAVRLREALREAVATDDGPTMVRFPKGSTPPEVPSLERVGSADIVRHGDDLLLVGVGPMVSVCLEAAELLASSGVQAEVVDPRWVVPVAPDVTELAGSHRTVVVVEDGVRPGGVGSCLTQELAETGATTSVSTLALPREFLPHGSRAQLLDRYGLTGPAVAARVLAMRGRRGDGAIA